MSWQSLGLSVSAVYGPCYGVMLRVIDQIPPTPCHTSLAQLYTPVVICNGAIQNTSNHFVFLYQQHALTLYFVSAVETHILVVFCILQNTEYIMCLGFSSDADNVRLTNVRILLLLLFFFLPSVGIFPREFKN